MAKIITHGYAKLYFKEQNCELLELNFINAHTKMKYKCKCNNISVTTWNNFRKGHRCLGCHGKRKITYEFLVDYFKEQNCELLEERYVKYSTPMQYRCSCGNISKISWDNFRKGHRCRNCGIAKISGDKNWKWNPDRKAVALNEKLRKRYYDAISRTLKLIGKEKNKKSNELLGFTAVDLKNHLESFDRWNNIVLNGDWSIDHIFPIKAFIEYAIYDPKKINCLDNLQPITLSENSSKADKYNKKEFETWLKSKNWLMEMES